MSRPARLVREERYSAFAQIRNTQNLTWVIKIVLDIQNLLSLRKMSLIR